MAHDENCTLARYWLNLLKSGQDEDCGLSKTGFGLAKNVGSKNRLRNTNLLDCSEAMPKLDLISRIDSDRNV